MEQFGFLEGANGNTPVKRLRISNGQLSACILNYGAIVQDLRFAPVSHPLVLGFDDFQNYLQHSQSFGILAGRHANRIKDGHLPLGDAVWQLDRNENNVTHLHGGSEGTGSRIWQIVSHNDASVHLRLHCKHGEMGYPGNLAIDCTISIEAPSTLVFDVAATTDATTVCNLAPHSYFNLDGRATIDEHHLQILADHYLPVDQLGIPTGEIARVAGTDFDFREARQLKSVIASDNSASSTLFDHNFCLHSRPRELSLAARLLAGSVDGTSVAMDVYTTEPGLQFFDGNTLDVPVAGLDGRQYKARAGLCLEPQRWPDSVHRSEFAGAVLQPGEQYHQLSKFRLTSD